MNEGERPRGSFFNDQKVADPPAEAWALASTESFAVHLMKAVAAVTEGLDGYMYDKGCDTSGQKDCPNMLDYKDTPDKYAHIQNIEITAKLQENLKQGVTKRVFKESGNGNVGFTVFRIDKESENLYEYDVLTRLTVDNDEITFVNTPTFYDNGVATNMLESVDGSCSPTGEPNTTVQPASAALDATVIGLIAAVVALVLIGLVVGFMCYILQLKRKATIIKS